MTNLEQRASQLLKHELARGSFTKSMTMAARISEIEKAALRAIQSALTTAGNEREAIVAWLRADAARYPQSAYANTLVRLASEIEAGTHLSSLSGQAGKNQNPNNGGQHPPVAGSAE